MGLLSISLVSQHLLAIRFAQPIYISHQIYKYIYIYEKKGGKNDYQHQQLLINRSILKINFTPFCLCKRKSYAASIEQGKLSGAPTAGTAHILS